MSDLTPAAAIRTAVFSSAVPAAPAPAPPTPAAPTAPAIPVEPYSHAGLSPTEAHTMAGWIKADLASGKMTQTQADKAFDDLGTPREQRVTSPDLRTDEKKLIDQHFPAAKPEEFSIRYANPGQAWPEMTPEMKQFDQSARTWLSGAEFPRDLGNSLISAIEKTAQHTKAMTPEQLDSYVLLENAKLERAYGDTLDAKLEAAGQIVQELEKKTPGLNNLLRSKGIGNNAVVVAQIIHQSERWYARRKGR